MKRFLHHKLHEVQNSPRQHVQSGDFILCAKAMDDVLEGGPFLGGGDGRGGALGAGGEGAWFGVSREGGEEEEEGGGGYVHAFSCGYGGLVAELEVERGVVVPDGGVGGEGVPEGCHVLEEGLAGAVGQEACFDFIIIIGFSGRRGCVCGRRCCSLCC